MRKFLIILVIMFAVFFSYRYYQEQKINAAFDKIYAPLN